MKHLYFVRHGLTVMNQQGVWSGITETPLTDEGKEQARQAGLLLADKQIDCIVSSPVKRAHDTAAIIAEEIGYDTDKIILNKSFVERDFGPLEGANYDPNYPLDTTDGVEHSDDVVARVSEGLEFLHTLDADTILVVGHGAIGRALQSLVHAHLTFHTSPKVGNAEVIKLL